jgi:hypothetical protein
VHAALGLKGLAALLRILHPSFGLLVLFACGGSTEPVGTTPAGPGVADAAPDETDTQSALDAAATPTSDSGEVDVACNDGTGATDCCPTGAAGGASCSVAGACFTRCTFFGDGSSQGWRGHLACSGGTWTAGHGLFPCSRK